MFDLKPLLLFASALILLSCSSTRPEGQSIDSLRIATDGPTTVDIDSGENVIQIVAECTDRDDAGICNKATCKADLDSDCTKWLESCEIYDHIAGGDSSSATCTRKNTQPNS